MHAHLSPAQPMLTLSFSPRDCIVYGLEGVTCRLFVVVCAAFGEPLVLCANAGVLQGRLVTGWGVTFVTTSPCFQGRAMVCVHAGVPTYPPPPPPPPHALSCALERVVLLPCVIGAPRLWCDCFTHLPYVSPLPLSLPLCLHHVAAGITRGPMGPLFLSREGSMPTVALKISPSRPYVPPSVALSRPPAPLGVDAAICPPPFGAYLHP
jgi:hypothetical protein